MKLKFEPSDFKEYEFNYDTSEISIAQAAAVANAKLEQYLKEHGVKVYGEIQDAPPVGKGYAFDQQGILKGITTHQGILINVEKIESVKCKPSEHDVQHLVDPNLKSIGHVCRKCHARLEQVYREIGDAK